MTMEQLHNLLAKHTDKGCPSLPDLLKQLADALSNLKEALDAFDIASSNAGHSDLTGWETVQEFLIDKTGASKGEVGALLALLYQTNDPTISDALYEKANELEGWHVHYKQECPMCKKKSMYTRAIMSTGAYFEFCDECGHCLDTTKEVK